MLSHVYMGLITVILVGYDSSFGNEQCHCPVTSSIPLHVESAIPGCNISGF